jgi:hypothetical protein
MAHDKIKVICSPLPFSQMKVVREFDCGVTISEMLDDLLRHSRIDIRAIVTIDGDIIPEYEWATKEPSPSNHVTLRVVPMGLGGGGKKNPIASLLSIAVMIAAPSISTAILGKSLAGQTIFGSFTVGKLFSGAIGMVSRLAISALMPPPKQSNASSNIANTASSPTQFIQGASNQIDPYGVVPICLGRNRYFPKQAALGYIETKGAQQFVRQLNGLRAQFAVRQGAVNGATAGVEIGAGLTLGGIVEGSGQGREISGAEGQGMVRRCGCEFS